MRRSEQINELATALAAAQAEYPSIPKSHIGKIQGQGKNGAYEYSYHYADLADTVDACRPINAKHGLAVSQATETIDGSDCLTTTLMHASGQWQESSRSLHAAKSDPQGVGSAITYARRYDYCAVLGIVADEDDDGAAASRPQARQTTRREPPKRQNAPKSDTGELATDKQLGMIAATFKQKGFLDDREVRHEYVKGVIGREFASTKELTKTEASKVIDALQAEDAFEASGYSDEPFEETA